MEVFRMRHVSLFLAGVLAVGLGAARSALADDTADIKAELESMKQRLAAQDRKIRELEGKAPTQDEIGAAVQQYMKTTPASAYLVGGADAGGTAGWPQGGAPFIKQGANQINFHMRNQVRYEYFNYSSHAVGTLNTPANTISDAAPRDRSGFEIERLYFGVDGTVFCPNISFNLVLNFDSDTGSGVEKEFMWIDWKYLGENHVRGGVDKVPFTYEEQNSTASLAFVDRSMVCKAFALGSDTGVALWGNFGSCDSPKAWMYKFAVSNGEGTVEQTSSVFSTNAFDTYSDQLLFSGEVEWTLTGKDWKFDEVDNRACDERCRLDASLGVCAYYEDDDDSSERSPGSLALRAVGPLNRSGVGAWFRGRYEGWTAIAEFDMRNVDYTRGSTSPDQQDSGAELTVHYRFAESNWGLGARAGVIWLDGDYRSLTVGTASVPIASTISEYAFVVNYFFWDHANKVSADVTWVQDNSGVKSSAPGYFWDPANGVVIEDGMMFRLQWQINF